MSKKSIVKASISTKELAARWNMSERTLEKWRYEKTGPKYVRIGSRTVRYFIKDIIAYESASTLLR